MKYKSGFTLLELLVAMSIVSILSAMVIMNLSDARASARDAKRKSDLEVIKTALLLHREDYGSFTQPENHCADTSFGSWGSGSSCPTPGPTGDWDPTSDLRDLVDGGYISSLPVDPINTATYYYYYEPTNIAEFGYTRRGEGFSLCAKKLEVTGTAWCLNVGYENS